MHGEGLRGGEAWDGHRRRSQLEEEPRGRVGCSLKVNPPLLCSLPITFQDTTTSLKHRGGEVESGLSLGWQGHGQDTGEPSSQPLGITAMVALKPRYLCTEDSSSTVLFWIQPMPQPKGLLQPTCSPQERITAKQYGAEKGQSTSYLWIEGVGLQDGFGSHT